MKNLKQLLPNFRNICLKKIWFNILILNYLDVLLTYIGIKYFYQYELNIFFHWFINNNQWVLMLLVKWIILYLILINIKNEHRINYLYAVYFLSFFTVLNNLNSIFIVGLYLKGLI